MSDHPPSQATDLAATHTIVDAARILGISENAVRKRIRRGTLPAHKEGDRWLVAIPGQADDHPPATTDLAAPASGQATDLAAAITPMAELIDRQSRELRHLTEAAAVWQVRALQAEERLKQLTAGEPHQDASVSTQEAPHVATAGDVDPSAPAPWWRRWWRSVTGEA